MYKAFNLVIDRTDIPSFYSSNEYYEKRKRNYLKKQEAIASILNRTLVGDTIDGNIVIKELFPITKADVFVSYSHNDTRLAFWVTERLTSIGLNVFVDSLLWGSCDGLLKELDKRYCYKEATKTYDYDSRNYSTAHVHAMLTSAIISAMDRAEVVLFLNTPNSVLDIKNEIANKKNSEQTLSPWLYEEVMFTKVMRKTPLSEYRHQQYNERIMMFSRRNLKISYDLSTNEMVLLPFESFDSWIKQCSRYSNGVTTSQENQKELYLNLLYKQVLDKAD